LPGRGGEIRVGKHGRETGSEGERVERESWERERGNPRREKERVFKGERGRTGGLAPLWFPAQRPLLGAPGLAAGQVAAPGGAGHRQRKEGAPPPQQSTGGGFAPLQQRERGALPPFNRRKERGLAPPSQVKHGAQVGPLAARDRRQGAGGAKSRGGSGHPKGEGKEEKWDFVVVMGLVGWWLI